MRPQGVRARSAVFRGGEFGLRKGVGVDLGDAEGIGEDLGGLGCVAGEQDDALAADVA